MFEPMDDDWDASPNQPAPESTESRVSWHQDWSKTSAIRTLIARHTRRDNLAPSLARKSRLEEDEQLSRGDLEISINTDMNPEPFVDASRVAEFLGIKPRRLLEMARAGQVPGYPLGTGVRRTWRFRLTEVSKAIRARR